MTLALARRIDPWARSSNRWTPWPQAVSESADSGRLVVCRSSRSASTETATRRQDSIQICFPNQLPKIHVVGVGKRDWVAAWGASPELGIESEPSFSGRTVRLIVCPTLGGDQIIVRISNLFGTGPLLIGAARVGFHAAKAALAPGSKQVLAFSGAPSVAIPVGARLSATPAFSPFTQASIWPSASS
jgi:hypothetical protein